MLAIKLLGIILIVISCSAAGFMKSLSVKARSRKLLMFCDGLDALYAYIEQGGCELYTAINSSFLKCGFICYENKNTVCCDNDLNREDKTLIDEFFASLGHSTKKAECDRISACRISMQKRLNEAERDTAQKCKLCEIFGICIGLTIGIFLI